jgi:glycosyltransferase involved in cell wall biosynthesis
MTPPLRILHLITDTDSGGAEVMLRNVVTRMDRTRFENRVVSMLPAGSLAPSIEAAGISVDSLGMRRGLPDPFGFARLLRIARAFRPDVLQTWLYHADLLGSVASRFLRVPAVAWNIRCSAMDLTQSGPSTRIAVRLLARMSRLPRAIAINTRAGQATHEELGYRPRAWAFLPNGFDVERFRPDAMRRAVTRAALQIADDALVVGLFARNDAMKDHATFFDAIAQLAPFFAGRDVHILLAGRDTMRLRELATRVAPQANVHLLGERHDMAELTAALDVACSSSAYGEGFPNTVGEAMATGVPCVVTDVGDAAWLVGNAGSVVPPRNARAFAEALRGMLQRPGEERQAIGARGRERIVRDFSIDSVVRQYEQFYATLVTRQL